MLKRITIGVLVIMMIMAMGVGSLKTPSKGKTELLRTESS